MTKTVKGAESFFKKATKTDVGFKEGFEQGFIQSPTISIPITIELTEQEKRNIQKILIDDYKPGKISENQVQDHVAQLIDLTKQIKSISAQSVLLQGERIKKAQDILRDYREGAFTKWLMSTYGNRQTPYSMLRYYEFYQSAPIETRAIIESAPKKAVYLLATRSGDKEQKIAFIQKYSHSTQSDLLILIQDVFPIAQINKRKSLVETTIASMNNLCVKLEKRLNQVSDDDRVDIKNLIERLEKI